MKHITKFSRANRNNYFSDFTKIDTADLIENYIKAYDSPYVIFYSNDDKLDYYFINGYDNIESYTEVLTTLQSDHDENFNTNVIRKELDTIIKSVY